MLSNLCTKVNKFTVVIVCVSLFLLSIVWSVLVSISRYEEMEVANRIFITNAFSNRPEAKKLMDSFNKLPDRVKSTFSKNGVKIEFIDNISNSKFLEDSVGLYKSEEEPTYGLFDYDIKTKCLRVTLLQDKYWTAKDPYTKEDSPNVMNFLEAIAMVYDLDFNSTRLQGIQSLPLMGDNGEYVNLAEAYLYSSSYDYRNNVYFPTLPYTGNINKSFDIRKLYLNYEMAFQYKCFVNQTSVGDLSSVCIYPDDFFRRAFTLYFMSSNTNHLLKGTDPTAFNYIKTITE